MRPLMTSHTKMAIWRRNLIRDRAVLCPIRLLADKVKRESRPSKKYTDTLTLPKTKFPLSMKNAATRELDIQNDCKFEDLYTWQRENNSGKSFVLHDGPPYANGKPHVGHAINKILKDITNRYRVLRGNKVNFIQGWDCHGLPIELKALNEGSHQKLTPLQIRDRARKFAENAIQEQMNRFKRWGVMADWRNGYYTFNPAYEAKEIDVFFDMYEKMGKTRAEIQKEYRNRKKAKLGEEYLQKERERVRNYYIPAKEMSKKKLKERNEKMKVKNRRSRARAKERLEMLRVRESNDDADGVSDSGYGSISASTSHQATPMVVRLPEISVIARARGAKRKQTRALARAHKSINLLEKQKLELDKKLKTKSKQIERLRKKVEMRTKSPETPPQAIPEPITPKSKTIHEVGSLKLTPRRKKTVAKKLLLTNVLLAEVKKTKEGCTRKKRTIIHNIVAGQISRKYKCMKTISAETGLSRRALLKCNTKCLASKIEKRSSISKVHAKTVIAFLSREDNCRIQPGKADSKKGYQTKVLTDYLKNLWQKFNAENPELKISLSTFCRLRPKYILLARFISRNACQCLKHQNMAMKVQAMRKVGVKISENPENICGNEVNIDQLMNDVSGEVKTVKYRMWKKVELENKMKKTMVVETEVSREDFCAMMKKEVFEFGEHVSRLRTQFKQLKTNKETLAEDHVIVQMDFAENYSCRALDEVQTAYWSLTSVTLHPIVMYYKQDNELKHKSFVVVSNTMVHSASTVAAFMDAFFAEMRNFNPSLKKVHYWTDSPSSQYRNRFMFFTLANHKKLYGCDAQWNYFEAGHGKSACDGLGGTTKRMADEASRQGNAVIQNAEDFQAWACHSSMKDVKFLFVDKTKVEQKQAMFAELEIKTVRNTMKLHAIALGSEDIENSNIRTQPTSCYCERCRNEDFCDRWSIEKFSFSSKSAKSNQGVISIEEDGRNQIEVDTVTETVETPNDTQTSKSNERQEEEEFINQIQNSTSVSDSLKPGDFVLALYDEHVYIGKVLEIDEEEGDINITFMEKVKELYRWPRQEDVLWIKNDQILAKIEEPQQTGKSKRLFKPTEDVKNMIVDHSQ